MSEVTPAAAPAVVIPPAVPAPAPVASATPVVVVPPKSETVPPGQPAAVAAPEAKGAPDKYEVFKVPEGMAAQPTLVESFSTVAKKLGLSQEAAQELVTFQMEAMREEIKGYDAKITAEKATIPALMAKDSVIGGANAVANLATMQRALTAFGSPELTAFLDAKETGPDIYLHFARFAFKVGQAIKEDSVAGTQSTTAEKTGPWTADDFYAKANRPNAKPAA